MTVRKLKPDRAKADAEGIVQSYVQLEAEAIADIPLTAVEPAPYEVAEIVAVPQNTYRKPGRKPKYTFDNLHVETLTAEQAREIMDKPAIEHPLSATERKALEIIKGITVHKREVR